MAFLNRLMAARRGMVETGPYSEGGFGHHGPGPFGPGGGPVNPVAALLAARAKNARQSMLAIGPDGKWHPVGTGPGAFTVGSLADLQPMGPAMGKPGYSANPHLLAGGAVAGPVGPRQPEPPVWRWY